MSDRQNDGTVKRNLGQKKTTNKSPKPLDPIDELNSLSSLGSLPDTSSVVKQFQDDDNSVTRMTVHTNNPSSSLSERISVKQRRSSRAVFRGHECPHCAKRFANSWAIPKHVSVREFVYFLVEISEKVNV